MANIEPNKFKDGIPLHPRAIMDRIAEDLAKSAALEAEVAELKSSAKSKEKASEALVEQVRALSELHRLGRPVYELVDGSLTAETPKSLPLWDAVEKSRERSIEAEKASAVVGAIYAKFGEGRAEGIAFDRVLAGGVRAHVQTEAPGEWTATVGGQAVPGAPWRSAADAMLAALGFAKDLLASNHPERSWEVSAVVPTAAAKTEEADDEGEGDDETATEPKSEAVRVPDSRGAEVGVNVTPAPARTWAPGPHDGKTFRSVHGGKGVAVSQPVAPGPWCGYIGTTKVGVIGTDGKAATEFDTPEEAEAAVEATLPATNGKAPKLTWLSNTPGDSAAEAAPPEAPKRRTRVAK